MQKDWRGDIVFSDSVAIFRGHIGPNKAHSHWASQLTIAVDGELEFKAGDSGRRRCKALYLSSKVTHQLFSGYVVSIYFDALSESRLKALGEGADNGWVALSTEQLPTELQQLSSRTDLEALMDSDLLKVSAPASAAARMLSALMPVF